MAAMKNLDTAAMRQLYDAGKDDRQIAAELGVTRTAVWTWRQEHHLQPQSAQRKYPPSPNKTRAKPRLDETAAMAAYTSGKTDKEIAEVCGCTAPTIANWRKRYGLDGNHAKQVPKGQAYELQAAAVEARARESGLTYGQYQARLFEAAQNPRGVPYLGTERS